MLVGPGGVIALVIGAWAGMWAVRAVPGRRFAVWYPALVAFVGAMLAFALLTAEAEAAIQLARWAQTPPAEQSTQEALSMMARPLVGAAVGLLLLLSGIAIAWSDTEPVGVHVELGPHMFERGAVVAIVLLLAVDVWMWVSLRQILGEVTRGQEDVMVAAAAMRWRIGVGAATSIAVLALAAGVGLLRQSRRPEGPAQMD
jgi:hypothetical protein